MKNIPAILAVLRHEILGLVCYHPSLKDSYDPSRLPVKDINGKLLFVNLSDLDDNVTAAETDFYRVSIEYRKNHKVKIPALFMDLCDGCMEQPAQLCLLCAEKLEGCKDWKSGKPCPYRAPFKQQEKSGSGPERITYEDEADLKGGVTVYWRGHKYYTGNRYHSQVELWYNGDFCRTVEIQNVYSLKDEAEWLK